MTQPVRSVTELSFKVAKLRVRLRLVRSKCWSANNSLNSSTSSIESDSSTSFASSPLSTSSPMRRCINLSDHSVNANEEFNSFFSSSTDASSSSEEMLAPVTPKFEVTEDMSSTHSEVKLAIYPLELDDRPVRVLEEVFTTSFPTDETRVFEEVFTTRYETATLPLTVQLFPSNPPPPPLPPRQKNNQHTPPKLPPKLKKRTRLFEDVVF